MHPIRDLLVTLVWLGAIFMAANASSFGAALVIMVAGWCIASFFTEE